MKKQQTINDKFITEHMIVFMLHICWVSAMKQKFIHMGFDHVMNKITFHDFLVFSILFDWEI